MTSWVNRTLVQAIRNGSATSSVSFTAATSGNLLVCVAEGAVTSTTPSGWTLPSGGSAVNYTGLYVWYKTASAGESSFSTTHNASNYPVGFVVYEFPAGSTFTASVASTSAAYTGAGPNLTGLTGTHSLFGVAAMGEPNSSGTITTTWTGTPTPTKDVDVTALGSPTDGYVLSLAVADGSTATSYQPTGAFSSGTSPAKECLTFAVAVASSTSYVTTGAGTIVLGTSSAAATVAVVAGAGTITAAVGSSASTTAVTLGAGTVTATTGGSAASVAVVTGTGTVALANASTVSAVAVAVGADTIALTNSSVASTTAVATGMDTVSMVTGSSASTVAVATGTDTLTLTTGSAASVPGSFTTTGHDTIALATGSAASTTALATGADTIGAATGSSASTVAVTDGHNTLTLTTGSVVGANPGAWHDITVTAILDPPRWQATLTTSRYTAELDPQRWKATL